ncbi:MAG: hypothetical protein J6I98_05300 [Clostridia bacterium]|nr:hypothetical protein [Clostridia bacterium]
MPDKVISNDSFSRVYEDENGKTVRFFFEMPEAQTPYAAARREDGNTICVEYLKQNAHCVSGLHNGFFHIGFESMMIHSERLCLHAACVETPLGGLLFSGRSGIGKSTQAELWCRYRGARQINGDRPILSKSGAGWLAWGSPYAGSSHCYVNDHCPVTAIVMLRQASSCSLRRLSVPEAFRAVWSGLTVQLWDKAFAETASSLAMELMGTVPVFEFACTPDEQAVDYLEQELRRECCL